jgi:hypothetical protein
MLVLVVALIASACSGNVFDLEVGQCFDDPDDFSEVSDVAIVDCAEPHDNEVYHLFDVPDGDYPGLTVIETAATDGCLGAFDAYVGKAYIDSDLDIRYLYPSEDTWGEGDREVVCSLYNLFDEQMTGSMRNSGI